MLHDSPAFSGFSVNDLRAAQDFYGKTLGLTVSVEGDMGLQLHLANSTPVFVYPKPNHSPATFTVLNFPVPDIAKAVADLKAQNVVFESYPDMTSDDDIAWGVKHNQGPNIAWFKDPAGNILSLIES